MKKKPIIITILCVILAGAVAFGIYWAVSNSGKVKDALSGANLYTKEDLDNAYSDGYDKALTDREALLNQIEQQKATLDSKNQQIIDLNKTVEAYEEFMNKLEEDGNVIATFIVDDNVYAVQKYTAGETVAFPVPILPGNVEVVGWTVNGVDIDISNYAINKSTMFVAKFVTYNVTFYNGSEVISAQTIKKGEQITIPTVEAPYGYKLAGWTVNGVDLVNVNETPNADAEYYAQFEIIKIQATFTHYKTYKESAGGGLTGALLTVVNEYYSIDVAEEYQGYIDEIAAANSELYLTGERDWDKFMLIYCDEPILPEVNGGTDNNWQNVIFDYGTLMDSEDDTAVIYTSYFVGNFTVKGDSWTVEITLVPES